VNGSFAFQISAKIQTPPFLEGDKMNTTVVGLFDYYSNLEWAIEVLENYGVDSDRISVVACDKEAMELGMAASAGIAPKGLVGLLLAGPSVFAFVIPGIGPVIATGTLASTLFTTLGTTALGARFGGAASGLLGALVDLGFSREVAESYVEGVKQGGILISVQTDLQNEYRIQAILRGSGALDIRCQTWQNEAWTAFEETEKSGEDAYQR
jgi:hypothetical protein